MVKKLCITALGAALLAALCFWGTIEKLIEILVFFWVVG